uniref:PDZ domain-containing protein n=1 Tax=Caenorhabditis japonica TaxID=281687 RepID=A0A8R1EBX6_CAEJA
MFAEEERIREVLRELKTRKEGGDVREDIERIERILRDPLFKQLSHQSSTFTQQVLKADNRRNSDAEKRVIELGQRAECGEIRENLKPNQKLHIVHVDAKLLDLVVLETKEKQPRLLIVGPKDVKNRSGGKLRIGDCVVSIDASGGESTALPTVNATANGANVFRTQNQTIAKSVFDTALQQSIDTNRHLVLGVIREATPMVTTAVSFSFLFLSSINHFAIAQTGRHEREEEEEEIMPTKIKKFAINKVNYQVSRGNLSGDWTQIEVIRLSTDNGGLGFGIVGGTSTGVVVKTILPGSPADKDGRLQPGDHILQIGNINTHGMSSQQVATILRHQHPNVDMIVGRPIAYADRPVDTPAIVFSQEVFVENRTVSINHKGPWRDLPASTLPHNSTLAVKPPSSFFHFFPPNSILGIVDVTDADSVEYVNGAVACVAAGRLLMSPLFSCVCVCVCVQEASTLLFLGGPYASSVCLCMCVSHLILLSGSIFSFFCRPAPFRRLRLNSLPSC